MVSLGISYFHQTFGERNRVERWFRTLKERTKRFYNNVNPKTVGSIEETAAAKALIHNLNLNPSRGGLVLPS